MIQRKSDVFDKFYKYKNKFENLLDRNIKIFRSNHGGEYMLYFFTNILKQNEIGHKFSTSCTSQQNGVIERHNRTLLDMVRSMLSHFFLDSHFLGEVALITEYLLKLVPIKIHNRILYELWYGRKRNLNNLRV